MKTLDYEAISSRCHCYYHNNYGVWLTSLQSSLELAPSLCSAIYYSLLNPSLTVLLMVL